MRTVCNPLENICLSEDIIPFTEFRRTLSNCFARTTGTHRPLIITQNGRAAKILLDIADFDGLKESFAILSDIRMSNEQIENGEIVPHDNVFDRLLKDKT